MDIDGPLSLIPVALHATDITLFTHARDGSNASHLPWALRLFPGHHLTSPLSVIYICVRRAARARFGSARAEDGGGRLLRAGPLEAAVPSLGFHISL